MTLCGPFEVLAKKKLYNYVVQVFNSVTHICKVVNSLSHQ